MGTSFHGSIVEKPGRGFIYQGLWEMVEKGSGGGASLSLRELCEETLERGFPCWGPWRICRNVWGVSLFIVAPLGNLEKGSTTRDFQRWLKGALEVERHCGVSDYDSEASRMRWLWPTRGCRTIEKTIGLIATGSRTAHTFMEFKCVTSWTSVPRTLVTLITTKCRNKYIVGFVSRFTAKSLNAIEKFMLSAFSEIA